jgi:hypothetical protein
MKKIILANVSSSGILEKASVLSGLKMFHNTASTYRPLPNSDHFWTLS